MSRTQSIRKWLFTGFMILTILSLASCSGRAATNAAAGVNTTVVVKRGTLVNAISATGSVRSAQSATLNWQTSGKVGTVPVKLGQTVKANDVLASLDPTTINQSNVQAQTDLINAQKALEDLKKPQPLQIAQAESNLAAAQTNLDNLLHPSDVIVAQAEAAVVTAQQNLTKAQNAFDSLNSDKGSELAIQTARANIILAQQKADLWQKNYDEINADPTTDYRKASALSNLTSAKNDLAHAQAVLNWYIGGPTQADINQKTSDLTVAKAQLADAQNKLAQYKNPTQSDIDLAKAKVADAQTALDTAKAGPTADDLTVAQNRVTLAQLAVNQTKLTAPFDGTITNVNVLSGDLVSNGKAAFQIDDMSTMLIDLSVSEIDVHRIQAGQPVSVTFDAIPNKEYAGQVSQIGMVGTLSQGSVYFNVTVQLTKTDSSVKPGMTAVSNVQVARAENVLEVPNRAIQTQGKNKFVTVVNNGVEQNVTVTVGLVSDTLSEVTSTGIKEGDQVLVVIPASTTTGGGGFGGGGAGGIFGPGR